jgi:negative regulator of flagellin synthesis FlgM
MSNRINPMDQGLLGKIGNKTGETGTARKVDGGPSVSGQGAPQSATSGDTVELTSKAKLLERLEKSLASVSEVDASRVAEVRQQIENGEYEIDAEKIAESMLRLDRELDDRS